MRKRRPQKPLADPKKIQRAETNWLAEKMRFGLLPFDKLVAPQVGIFDAPTRCYTINEQWAAIVMGLVQLLAETRMWKDAEDESFPAITEVMKFLEGGNCIVNCTDVLNCVETDPNQIAFSSALFAQFETNTANHIAELEAQYDGTATSVADQYSGNAPVADPAEDNALCYACRAFVGFYGATKLFKLEQSSSGSFLWDAVVNAGKAVYGAVKSFVGGLFGVDTTTYSTQQQIDAISDPDAIDALACCLYDSLRAAAITQVTFSAALAACAASLVDNAKILADVFLQDADNLQEYVYFLESFNEAIKRQTAGETLDCNCNQVVLIAQNGTTVTDQGGGWWLLTTPFDGGQSAATNGRYFYQAYVISPDINTCATFAELDLLGVTPAPTGNRHNFPCGSQTGSFGSYGVGLCVWQIQIRAYENTGVRVRLGAEC